MSQGLQDEDPDGGLRFRRYMMSDFERALQDQKHRPYRSKRIRPCDRCRKLRVRCHITDEPPCLLCREKGSQCTFKNKASQRMSKSDSSVSGTDAAEAEAATKWSPKAAGAGEGTTSPSGASRGIAETSDCASYVSEQMAARGGADLSMMDHLVNGGRRASTLMDDGGEGGGAVSTMADEAMDGSIRGLRWSTDAELLLELESSSLAELGRAPPAPIEWKQLDEPMNPVPQQLLATGDTTMDPCQIVGLSASVNPVVLSRFDFDEANVLRLTQDNAYKLVYQSDTTPVIMSGSSRTARDVEDSLALARMQETLTGMVPADVGLRLFQQFWRNVYPYFPVLSYEKMHDLDQDGLSNIPVYLLATLYTLTLPFQQFDDELCIPGSFELSAADMYRFSLRAVFVAAKYPSIELLQAVLLLLQADSSYQPAGNEPTQRLLLEIMRGTCFALGLNQNCSGWDLGTIEKRVRKRLWWAMFVLETWHAMLMGTVIGFSQDDYNVDEPTGADFGEQATSRWRGRIQHFGELTRLTLITFKIHKTFFTVAGVARTQRDPAWTIKQSTELQSQLRSWLQKLPHVMRLNYDIPEHEQLNATPAVHLMFGVNLIMLFRAVFHAAGGNPEESKTWNEGAKRCVQNIIVMVRDLRPRNLQAFWHGYSRYNFEAVSSFIADMCINSADDADAKVFRKYMDDWRQTMRVQGQGSHKMQLGLLTSNLFHRSMSRLSKVTATDPAL